MKAHVPSTNAMGFYHSDGFVPAWRQATKFAGEQGRIGTMLDVVDARINSGVNNFTWRTYFTTTSAEYFGYSKGGVRILIIAHGVGPMSSLGGIQNAYSYQYNDKDRNRHGGRIPQSEFWKLESGVYGAVSIVEFDPILERYSYPLHEYLTADQAKTEPYVLARLGPRAETYIEHQRQMAMQFHDKEHGRDIPNPYLFKADDARNCPYVIGGFGKYPRTYKNLDKGHGALAHLLSIGGLTDVSHQSQYNVSSLANDISCHSWWDGVRLVGIRGLTPISVVHPGFGNTREVLIQNWYRLMKPAAEQVELQNVYVLIKHGIVMFTQYRKQGTGMDTEEPEHLVTAAELVGGVVPFVTETLGHPSFFNYDTRGVVAMMPPGANAYRLVSSPECISVDGKSGYHKCLVQFYRVEIDTSKRLPRVSTLENDYDLLMELVA